MGDHLSPEQLRRSELWARSELCTSDPHPDAKDMLAGSLRLQGRYAEAKVVYDDILRRASTPYPAALEGMATCQFELGDHRGAEVNLRTAFALRPSASAATNLAKVIGEDKARFDEAMEWHERALAISPTYAEAWLNKASLFYTAGLYQKAEHATFLAADLDDRLPRARLVAGNVLWATGHAKAAVAQYDKAIEIDASFAPARYNKALVHLQQQEYDQGWPHYDARWAQDAAEWREFGLPAWEGQKTKFAVLVWGEQGIGDELLFCSMIPDLLMRCPNLVLEVTPKLVTLLQRAFPQVIVVPRTQPAHPVARNARFSIPMGDLGRYLRPDKSSFINHGAYLCKAFDKARRDEENFHATLQALDNTRVRVGLAWRSSAKTWGEAKSMQLADLGPVLATPGIQFVNLQYGDTKLERAPFGSKIYDAGFDLKDDIEGVAALTATCDLVITTSNSIAHLAGALGKETWVLLPRGVGRLWYWPNGRLHSPWYPSVIMKSQHSRGSWYNLVAEVREDLRGLVGL